MRSKDEVFDKFHEMRDLKLKDMKERYMCRSHLNCSHNSRLKVHGKGLVGFCQNPMVLKQTKAGMFVCNDDDTVKHCKVYDCRNTDERVEELFNEILKSPSRCGETYPKLAMLIWFLQDGEGGNRWNRFSYLVKQGWLSFWKIVSLRWL